MVRHWSNTQSFYLILNQLLKLNDQSIGSFFSKSQLRCSVKSWCSVTVLSYPPWLFLHALQYSSSLFLHALQYSSSLHLCCVTRLKSTTSLFRVSAPFLHRGLNRHGRRRHQLQIQRRESSIRYYGWLLRICILSLTFLIIFKSAQIFVNCRNILMNQL